MVPFIYFEAKYRSKGLATETAPTKGEFFSQIPKYLKSMFAPNECPMAKNL